MEIALLHKDCLRIKGKHATFVVDPTKSDKSAYNATIVLAESRESLYIAPDVVVIEGPGEYEVAGVKMSAVRDGEAVIYSMVVDGVEVVMGAISSFEKMKNKFKEQSVVVAYADAAINASFVPSIATNVIIFYGDQAQALASSLGKADVVPMAKYLATHDKLPQQLETVVLG